MRSVALAVFVAVVAFGGLRADPYVGYCYPAGLQAGTTNRFVVGGQRMWSVTNGWISGEGVKIIGLERVPNFPVPNGKGQKAWLEKWIRSIQAGHTERPPLPLDDADLVGWTRCSWWERLNELDALKFSIVAQNFFTPRNALQMSPSLSERVIVTIAARADAKPGVCRMFLHDWRGASSPHPLLVTSEPHLAEPLYAPPRKDQSRVVRRPKPVSLPIVLDGQVLPEETDGFDLHLEAGTRAIFLLTGRELTPYLGDAVPGFFNPVLRLVNAEGREVAFADDYGFLPDPVLSYEVPTSGVYRLEIRDNVFRGRADFVYSVFCHADGRETPSVSDRAFAVSPRFVSRPLKEGGMTQVFKGRLEEPGETAEYELAVNKPGEWTFDLFARRQGSPLDAVVRLYGPLKGFFWKDGPLLATWDDVTNAVFIGSIPQSECDPVGTWSFVQSGLYRVTVEDRMGGGGADYDFTLCAAPTRPSFEVYSTKSTLVFPANRKEPAKMSFRVVRRGGFSGAIRLDGGERFRLDPSEISATNDQLTVRIWPKAFDWSGVCRMDLQAIGETEPGVSSAVPVVAADESEQAFAYTHLLPAEGFLAYVRPPEVRVVRRPTCPVEMPYDHFLPRRLLGDAVREVLVKLPQDVEDGAIETHLASSVARVRQQPVLALAVESADARHTTWAVLSGVSRLVDRNRNFADGDARRIRTLAPAVTHPYDNDVLVYVPSDVNGLSPGVKNLARRFTRQGVCFDFVTEKTLGRAPCGRVYKVVVVPQDVTPSEEATAQLAAIDKKGGCKVVYAADGEKALMRKIRNRARKESLPADVRFARFGQEWGEGIYFVHNPTAKTVARSCLFNIRGKARTAFVLDVDDGRVDRLVSRTTAEGEKFDLSLKPGASAWIYVSVGRADE